MRFDHEGISSQLLQASFNGAAVTGKAEAVSGGTRLVLEARLPTVQLFGWATMSSQEMLRGTSTWQGELLIPKLRAGAENQLKMALRSSLEGTEVALPSPLGKASDQRRDFSVAMVIADSGSRYDVSYGADVGVRLIRGAGKYSRWSGYLHFGQDDPPALCAGLVQDRWRDSAGG